MPKERSHWIIALKTRSQLPEGPVKELLYKEEASYLFGAVAPDSVYVPSDLSASHRKLIPFFHGEKNHRTLRFWQTARTHGWTSHPALRAFLLGLTSHIQSDACFHPAVYYFCGWPHHPRPAIASLAMSRHYRLETLLDFYLMEKWNTEIEEMKLYSLLKQVPMAEIAEMAGEFFFPGRPLAAGQMEALFRRHGYYQSRFSRWDYITLSWLLKILGIPLKGKRELFYRKPRSPMENITFQYRHPVTGEEQTGRWLDLAEESCRKAASLFLELADIADSGEEKEFPPGPHPEWGIPADEAKGKCLRYSSPRKSILLFRHQPLSSDKTGT